MQKSCVIVGGGPSLIGFDFSILEDTDVIAVNQAIFQIPKAKYFITMDYTWVRKSGLESVPGRKDEFLKHPSEKVFVLAVPDDRLISKGPCRFMDKQFGLLYDLSIFDRIIRPSDYGGLGRTFEDFRYGSESGYSAIQLAVITGYDQIYLLGFDFCVVRDITHFHGDYLKYPREKNYQKKLDEFLLPYPGAIEALRKWGIPIYSCSHISKLNQYILYINSGNVL